MSNRDRIVELIENQAFEIALQPIVNADGSVAAYEALCRPTAGFGNPAELFEAAAAENLIPLLSLAVRTRAIEHARTLAAGQSLFINLHPDELDETLLAWCRCYSSLGERVVFEITETRSIQDFAATRALLASIQALGFRVAIDDLGEGYAGLKSLVLLRPDFCKLDISLVRSAPTVQLASCLIRHLVAFAKDAAIQIIAEGIEEKAEFDQLVSLGSHLLQGYWIGRPEIQSLSLRPQVALVA